jgi:dipeptidase
MCTSIMAGMQATSGGVVLLARNEDFTRNNWNKYLTFRSVPQYQVLDTPVVSDGSWTLGNGLAVPVPDTGYAYSAMPDAAGGTEASSGIGDHFFFEERGINTRNVAISATNSMATNPEAAAADSFVSVGVAESVIPTLILPQAESARHGVRLLGSYVEQCGASEPNGVLIGDPAECWYVEIGSAHQWIAVRVPDGAYVAVANGLRIHDVDLDSEDTLSSSNLFEFVVQHQLLEHPDRHAFDFAEAFGILGVDYNQDRIWLAQKILTPSRDQPPRQPQYPLFLQPDHPLAVADVMGVLRATYAGTVLAGKADRPIGYERTAESHIITLDGEMPHELAGVIWQAISTPLDAPYMPLHNVLTDIPSSYTRGANEFTPLSAYWAFHGTHALHTLLDKLGHSATPSWWSEFEKQCLAEAPLLNTMLTDTYRKDSATAIDLARRASAGVASQAVDLATRATATLLTDLANQVAADHARTISAVGA